MTVYMYTPFKDDGGVLHSIDMWQSNVRDTTVEVKFNELDKVPEGEPLFINGHGYVMMPYIGGTKAQRLDFAALGQRLIDDGLKKTHRKIVIWACYCGDGAKQKVGFAYWFWHWMHTHGFAVLTVYAYTEVTVDPMCKRDPPICVKIDPKKERLTEGWMTELPGTAKDYRIRIDATGAVAGINHPVDD